MRKHGKVDAIQKECVDEARKFGASVISLASVGKGCPDLLIGWRGKNFLVEIKSHDKATLTQDQRIMHATYCGKIYVVYSAEELLETLLNDGA